MRRALAIGGLDPTGGAGLLLDAFVLAAAGYAPATAVTLLSAQNSASFLGAWPVAPALLRAQLEAVAAEGALAAVKIGALGSVRLAETVAAWLRDGGAENVVLDPVLAASSGGPLIDDGRAAVAALAPQLAVITPNAAEAALLSGLAVADLASAARAAAALAERLGCAVVVSGLREPGSALATDVLARGHDVSFVPHALVEVQGEVRGTGCMLAGALACALADGSGLGEALLAAQGMVQRLVREARPLGRGRLQVDLRRLPCVGGAPR